MYRLAILLFALIFSPVLFPFFFPGLALAEFPTKPLKIVVYTQPGGLIDITARKAASIMQKKYVDKPVVVENKKGAGGIVALSHVLRQPADGHTVFGLTSSVVSKLVASNKESELEKLHFLTRMAEDFECLITSSDSSFSDVKQLISEAKQKAGAQVWAGPASEGTDHLFAVKFWEQAGIRAKWIPYRSGSEAIAAVLGSHADVYVGNPGDTLGRPKLKILAVASPERLAKFPDVPTFRELGMDALTNESLWRGFAVRGGTSPDVITSLEEIFAKVNKDPEWLAFLAQADINPVFDTAADFKQIVQTQVTQDKKALSSAAS